MHAWAQVVPAGDPDGIAALQRAMGVDVLITGGTHEFKVSGGRRCSPYGVVGLSTHAGSHSHEHRVQQPPAAGADGLRCAVDAVCGPIPARAGLPAFPRVCVWRHWLSVLPPHPTPHHLLLLLQTVKTGSCLHISPGSASGAYHPTKADVTPSFVLLDLDGARVTVYVYQLVNGEVKVEKIDYAKAS